MTDRKGETEKDIILQESEYDLIAETMARVAIYNITGAGREPSVFEKRLAEKEYAELIEVFDKW